MVITSEHMKEMKIKTQSPQFMCGSRVQRFTAKQSALSKWNTCHKMPKQHSDLNLTRARGTKLEK